MAMAATNQPLPGLQVTAPDEDMEISDYERNADDIDIDIDLTVDPSHHEDENMDDDRSEHDSKDDVMIDGDGHDEDGMMQDNVSVPDEHLTDASDVGYVDVDVKEALQSQAAAEPVDVHVQDSTQAEDFIDYDDTPAAQPQQAPQAAQEPADQSITEQTQFPDGEKFGNQEANIQPQNPEFSTFPEASVHEHPSVSDAVGVEGAASAVPSIGGPSAAAGGNAPPAGESHVANDSIEAHSGNVPGEPEPESQSAPAAEDATHLSTEAVETQSEAKDSPHDGQHQRPDTAPETAEQQTELENSAQEPSEAVDFSTLPFDPKNDAGSQPANTATSLHPVVVVYEGDEISLFPPHGSDTSDSFYFLQDESMADETIRSLLQACRQVLGETVQDEDELEIEIAELGLCLSEDSENAANTSFSQILDVYLQLHQLDGHQSPGPLYMTLNTKTRFSARMDALLAAIADGRGMSQLSFLEDVVEDAYAGSENELEEQASVHRAGELDGKGHAEDPVSKHGAEQEASHEEDAFEKPPTESEQKADDGSTAPQQSPAQQEDDSAAGYPKQSNNSPQSLVPDSTHEEQTHGYVSPKPEDLPEYESSDEGDGPIAHDDARGPEDGSKADAAGPDHPEGNDQINYDDGDVAEEAGDDVSLRSSTLQGDNTPAAVDEGASQRGSNASNVSAAVGDALQDGSHGEGTKNMPSTRDVDTLAQFGNETRASGSVAVEESQELEQVSGHEEPEGAEASLEEELERELNAAPESFSLPEGIDGMPDEGDYTASYEEDGEHAFEQDGDVQENADGERLYEEFVVVEAREAPDGSGAPDEEQDADDQEASFGEGFDDAEAEQTAQNDLDDTHSELERGLVDDYAGQAQPNAHASEEDELDTIDYDDEELSRSPSAQQDEPAVASPSSAKRGWEELGQDDEDEASEQAPKKVKSE